MLNIFEIFKTDINVQRINLNYYDENYYIYTEYGNANLTMPVKLIVKRFYFNFLRRTIFKMIKFFKNNN